MAASEAGSAENEQEYSLRKYLLLLATLVASVTYSAGFNPPGGVWQDTDAAAGHLAGDPIIRDVRYVRYAVFFYCNASAFASSLVVIVLILLLLAVVQEKRGEANKQGSVWMMFLPLRVVMVLDLVSLMMAYAAGTCRDTFTTIYSSLLVGLVFVYLVYQVAHAYADDGRGDEERPGPAVEEDLEPQTRKALMLLAAFAVSVTYAAGLSAPGGFWGSAEGGHRPGDAVLKERHSGRLTAFFVCNTTAFVASLLIIVLLLDRKLHRKKVWSYELYGCIMVALMGLVGAYAAGSCRDAGTTAYVACLVGAVVVCVHLQLKVKDGTDGFNSQADGGTKAGSSLEGGQQAAGSSSEGGQPAGSSSEGGQPAGSSKGGAGGTRAQPAGAEAHKPAGSSDREAQLNQARSLVLLLATLAATITYQAGLDPPGGFWQENGPGDAHYKAGDPILLTTNPRRYKAFYYCNSVAFVASLVAIVLVQENLLLEHHALEAAMILDLFGLIGAYAAGTCRDVSGSVYVMAIAGAVLVYVVIHVIFITLDETEAGDGKQVEQVEKRRKRLLMFAILAATITYQAGLTPPSGFLPKHESSHRRAGDPILLHNSPRRYEAFFYCNSVSFMLSIALIILLVNRNLYRPAIRSCALSVCTAAGLFGLTGAYAAGSTQHMGTSVSVIVMVAVLFMLLVLLLLVYIVRSYVNTNSKQHDNGDGEEQPKTTASPLEKTKKTVHAQRKYVMLLGILVASVTYQAGLDPPGGVWQGGHNAGSPVMQDNRRRRYLAFFYCNSTSFAASVVAIAFQLVQLMKNRVGEHGHGLLSFSAMKVAIALDLLALLAAYAAGSSRARTTSGKVVALLVAVLAYFAIHLVLSHVSSRVASKRAK